MRPRRLLLVLTPLVLLGAVMTTTPTARADAPAAPSAPGRIEYRIVQVKGEHHRYAVWVPPGYDPARAWPCVVFLHGSGECGVDGEKPTRIGLIPAVQAHPERWPCLVVVPQKPREEEEWEEREALVFAALRDAGRTWRVDPDRVALTGLSQGGHGTWMIGARHPERFSCLVTVCGYGRARTIAPRVLRLPMWSFHGLRDDVVDPRDTEQVVAESKALRAAQGLDTTAVRMTLYPEANHGAWDAAYAEPELPGWMLGAVRPRR